MIRRRGFTLLEVLVSLAILAVVLTMVMRSFTTSLRAVRLEERVTMGTMLARSLIEEYEVVPPPRGSSDGEFGKDFAGFSYVVNYEDNVIDYPDIPTLEEVGKMVPLRRVSVDIYWRQAGKKERKPKRVVHVETAITGSERYTLEARKQNNLLEF